MRRCHSHAGYNQREVNCWLGILNNHNYTSISATSQLNTNGKYTCTRTKVTVVVTFPCSVVDSFSKSPAVVLNSTTTDVYIVNKHDTTYTMMVVYQLMKSVQLPSS